MGSNAHAKVEVSISYTRNFPVSTKKPTPTALSLCRHT
jgi:hypothetical protein